MEPVRIGIVGSGLGITSDEDALPRYEEFSS
jgi:hypothetical protein